MGVEEAGSDVVGRLFGLVSTAWGTLPGPCEGEKPLARLFEEEGELDRTLLVGPASGEGDLRWMRGERPWLVKIFVVNMRVGDWKWGKDVHGPEVVRVLFIFKQCHRYA